MGCGKPERHNDHLHITMYGSGGSGESALCSWCRNTGILHRSSPFLDSTGDTCSWCLTGNSCACPHCQGQS